MAKGILDMITWHPEMEIVNCQITYINRGSPDNMKTIPASSIKHLEKGFMMIIDGSQIPYHRIIRIKCNGKVFWEKSMKGDLYD